MSATIPSLPPSQAGCDYRGEGNPHLCHFASVTSLAVAFTALCRAAFGPRTACVKEEDGRRLDQKTPARQRERPINSTAPWAIQEVFSKWGFSKQKLHTIQKVRKSKTCETPVAHRLTLSPPLSIPRSPEHLPLCFVCHFKPLYQRPPDHFRTGWKVWFKTAHIIDGVDHLPWQPQINGFSIHPRAPHSR